MNPDKAQQALATTEVDISQIEPGKSITVLWRGKPVFERRTPEEIQEARSVNILDLPDPQKDEDRVKDGKDEWLVMLGVCTHLGCVPLKTKVITKDGFVHVTALTMTYPGELEKDLHQKTWKFLNTSL